MRKTILLIFAVASIVFVAIVLLYLITTKFHISADSVNSSSPFVNVAAFGAKGDGATDDTEAIQKALNSSASIYFPSGNYISRSVTVKDGSYLFGDGESTIIHYKEGESAILFDCGSSAVQFSNLEIDGGSNTSKKSAAQEGKRSAIKISNYAHGSMITNLIIHGFDNTAIMIGGTVKDDRLSNLQIQNTQVYNSYYGINETSPLKADYIQYNSIDAHSNKVGLLITSGNSVLTNIKANDNSTGLFLRGTGEVNNGHGSITGSNLSHNQNNVYAIDVSLGYNITSSTMIGGDIYIQNSQGITISNSILDIGNYFLIGGGSNSIRDNFILGKRANIINHNYSKSQDKTVFTDNYRADGTFLESQTELN